MPSTWDAIRRTLRAVAVTGLVWPLAGGTLLAQYPGGGPARPSPLRPDGLPRTAAAAPVAKPAYGPLDPSVPVVDVRIQGHRSVDEQKVRSYLTTRVNRPFDPETVQADVRALVGSGLFHDVRTYQRQVPNGVIVTFEVVERPTIGHIHFLGNESVRDKTLLKKCGLAVGQPLNRYSVEEGRRKLEEYYRERGHGHVQVTVHEGTNPQDAGVAYLIHEGARERIYRTEFLGNTIASDARLKTQIQSKPGPLWMFKGKVDRDQIDEDVDRLTAYYRSLGFFRARVGRELEFDESGDWLTLRFVIDEGPRYVVRNVAVVGNQKFASGPLMDQLELRSGDHFNLAKMNQDTSTLRDLYGSYGHIFADIKAEPRFLEEPGQLDLVYSIQEGEPYHVGRIVVNIEGDFPHTRQSVVLNRISLRPGDLVDIREIRASERRLKSSQLFLNDPARGVAPQIVVKPPDLEKTTGTIADREPPPPDRSFRGQNPDSTATSPTAPSAPRGMR